MEQLMNSKAEIQSGTLVPKYPVSFRLVVIVSKTRTPKVRFDTAARSQSKRSYSV